MSLVPIASVTVASPTATIAFTSIPTSFGGKNLRDLMVVGDFDSNSLAEISVRMNAGVTGYAVYARGSGSSVSSSTAQNTPIGLTANIFTNLNIRGVLIVNFMDYAQTNKDKHWLSRFNVPQTSSYPGVSMAAGRFQDTSAITSLTFMFGGGQQFQTGNTFKLFGIEG